MQTPQTPTELYDFHIPKELIAQRPRPFGSQKLLVFTKEDSKIRHLLFEDLPKLLRAGDLLVLNDTKVVPCQIRTLNGPGALLFLNPLVDPSLGDCEVILSHEWAEKKDQDIVLQLPLDVTARVTALVGGDPQVHKVKVAWKGGDFAAYLEKYGEMPLPPYVERPPDEQDKTTYQASVAKHNGAVAAPTASLHFYPDLLERLNAAGIEHVTITLHVGYGTFRSFSAKFMEQHRMDLEQYRVSAAVAQKLWQTKKQGRRIIAVGTTSTRVLESIAPFINSERAPTQDIAAKATLFIYPPYKFKVTDALITNFHYPKTSVLSLTAAMVGSRELLLDNIYQNALRHDYLWYSYGDGMLVLSKL